ncbi:hypothetical protein GCM10010275_42820 [Streptomyces litmocidini]|uniref:hypothetical protein n=1 Tax=Streptomyces litmocidini TaxID=67318 RepID=UPI00167EE383|nr:hypothetical protein [Streptomyces litmocidini]GGU99383.1 hypothetical protein GCM10010275_42820 [Streptomyces litmocidini]
MRLRSALATAAAALLLATVPGSASAAEGQFRYTYRTSGGYEAVGFLDNPDSGTCIDIQGTAQEPGSAAYAPKNRTDATAVVFLEPNCEGDSFYSLRPGGGASDRLLVRSVLFS